jgi:hypothetical protein
MTGVTEVTREGRAEMDGGKEGEPKLDERSEGN